MNLAFHNKCITKLEDTNESLILINEFDKSVIDT
jgi:hypothetical protein